MHRPNVNPNIAANVVGIAAGTLLSIGTLAWALAQTESQAPVVSEPEPIPSACQNVSNQSWCVMRESFKWLVPPNQE